MCGAKWKININCISPTGTTAFCSGLHKYKMLKSPRSGVLFKGTDGGEGEGVLGGLLVVSHRRVLKPLTPEDLGGKVRCPHLETN